MSGRVRIGNVLGELTAEADGAMLSTAFYESRNYRELIHGSDFRFVVGRRGTGKSALSRKVADALGNDKSILLLMERPAEEIVSAWHSDLLKVTSDYLGARKITRLAWKVQVLTQVMDAILSYYKSDRIDCRDQMTEYRRLRKDLFEKDGLARSLEAFRIVTRNHPCETADAIPQLIAEAFELSHLESYVYSSLRVIKRKVVFIYDGLDEGWIPNQVATGLLGGLAKVAAEFKESQGIHCLLFVRDNMFRALAEFDGDYSRNIEGNTLRLHWDEETLLQLVAMRLRAAFGWKGENDIRAWNRFAKRGLEGIDGFRKCLKLTLYRPRDVIALLNGAYQVTCAARREELIESDVETTATKISQTRLADLYKEYEHVLPGLPFFAEAFRARAPRMTYEQALGHLDESLGSSSLGMAARDFALLRTGGEAFNALHSVGFIGVQDAGLSVRFCHDGSNTDVQALPANTTVVVHPCYWRSLELFDSGADEIVLKVDEQVDDEDDLAKAKSVKKEVADMRLRKLGTVIGELGKIPEGRPGAHDFEKWVYDAARYLFAKGLDNIAWRPNPSMLQQRDIVGTLRPASGFWHRVGRYDVSQFIIEVKNFREIGQDEFRQAWGYLNGPHGRCLLIVTRADSESLSERERLLVKEGYDSDPHKLVMLIPANLLQRALRKMQNKNEQRDDYIDEMLKKRMDLFERQYIQQRYAKR